MSIPGCSPAPDMQRQVVAQRVGLRHKISARHIAVAAGHTSQAHGVEREALGHRRYALARDVQRRHRLTPAGVLSVRITHPRRHPAVVGGLGVKRREQLLLLHRVVDAPSRDVLKVDAVRVRVRHCLVTFANSATQIAPCVLLGAQRQHVFRIELEARADDLAELFALRSQREPVADVVTLARIPQRVRPDHFRLLLLIRQHCQQSRRIVVAERLDHVPRAAVAAAAGVDRLRRLLENEIGAGRRPAHRSDHAFRHLPHRAIRRRPFHQHAGAGTL